MRATNWEEMARPSSVPPYSLVVEASTWEKASKMRLCFVRRDADPRVSNGHVQDLPR